MLSITTQWRRDTNWHVNEHTIVYTPGFKIYLVKIYGIHNSISIIIIALLLLLLFWSTWYNFSSAWCLGGWETVGWHMFSWKLYYPSIWIVVVVVLLLVVVDTVDLAAGRLLRALPLFPSLVPPPPFVVGGRPHNGTTFRAHYVSFNIIRAVRIVIVVIIFIIIKPPPPPSDTCRYNMREPRAADESRS